MKEILSSPILKSKRNFYEFPKFFTEAENPLISFICTWTDKPTDRKRHIGKQNSRTIFSVYTQGNKTNGCTDVRQIDRERSGKD